MRSVISTDGLVYNLSITRYVPLVNLQFIVAREEKRSWLATKMPRLRRRSKQEQRGVERWERRRQERRNQEHQERRE